MTNKDAWLYAASWGSLIRNGDPGACMYGFNENFTVQSEDHRTNCLNWIENHCRPLVLERPNDYADDELETMDAFVQKLKEAAIN